MNAYNKELKQDQFVETLQIDPVLQNNGAE